MAKLNLVILVALCLIIGCRKGDKGLSSSGAKSLNTVTWPIHLEAEDYAASYGVGIQPTGDYLYGGGDDVTSFSNGDSIVYSVTIPSAGLYRIKLHGLNIGANDTGSFVVKKAGVILGSATMGNNLGTLDYYDCWSDIALPAGTYNLAFHSTGDDFYLNWIDIDTSTLILLNQFEDDNTNDEGQWVEESAGANSIQISNALARRGAKSWKFNLNKIDSATGWIRAEMHLGCETDNERWYGFSQYLTNDFANDGNNDLIGQWHEYPDFSQGESWRNPPISLQVQNNHYYVKVFWCALAVNTNAQASQYTYDLGTVTKGTWIDWVFHIKFAYDNTGILEVWKNGVKVVNRVNLPNSYNDQFYPYFKIGEYKAAWNGWQQYSPGTSRTLYYDDVRIGNRYSSYNAVTPQWY